MTSLGRFRHLMVLPVTDRPEDFYDDSRAVDRRLARESIEVLSTNGPYSEVTFRNPRWRSSDLSFKDATKLFDAISFHSWQYGNLMNCHVSITWRTLNVLDDEHAAALLSL